MRPKQASTGRWPSLSQIMPSGPCFTESRIRGPTMEGGFLNVEQAVGRDTHKRREDNTIPAEIVGLQI